ncbi:hypothetical protein ACS5PN_12400 [Roseateles sp. NT4]|uniref:hypothetical protein n=1 Tax=Roseateles sp. NT4 TaxID=3453715 RepID=UPI003EEF12A1
MTLMLALTTPLSGCAPGASRYVRVEVDNAKYFGPYCNGSMGRPTLAFFPFNGVFISALIDERGEEIGIGVHVPSGITAQILQRSVTIRPKTGADKLPMSLPLEPASYLRYSGFTWPPGFHTTDPFDREDYFGVLVGAARTPPRFNSIEAQNLGAKWYRFTVSANVKRLDSGVIELPAMRINGVEFKGPTIPYDNVISIFPLPINC